jgi:DNA-binding response OmpR family regulator
MARILVADDEQDLVWALRHSLGDEGYEVFTAYDGLEALSVASRHYPDLIILDIKMPQLDGLEVCRRLRRNPALASVPILFLTVLRTVDDMVTGLDEGGDDYLVKPLDLLVLKARIRALLRRCQRAPESPGTDRGSLMVGIFTLNLRTCQVCVEERTVQLTPTEFSLLHYLMVYAGKVLSSQQLLQQLWGYPPRTSDPGLVRWHIRNLRLKIEPDPFRPTYIRTVSRHGYIFDP